MESQKTHDKNAITPKEIVIYQTEDGAVKEDVQMADETVWLTMDGMAKLFDKSRSTINEHILNIFEEGELTQEESVFDRFQTKTQLMIAKINKTFDRAIRNRFFFLVCG